jgi:hypothetical protein
MYLSALDPIAFFNVSGCLQCKDQSRLPSSYIMVTLSTSNTFLAANMLL